MEVQLGSQADGAEESSGDEDAEDNDPAAAEAAGRRLQGDRSRWPRSAKHEPTQLMQECRCHESMARQHQARWMLAP